MGNLTVPLLELGDDVGWVNAPNLRGTIDIIWSCLLVLFTAVYTVIHLNLPGPKDSTFILLLRKVRWTVFAVLTPDLLTGHAAWQWKWARQSVSEMHSLGHTNWTLVHAFYANSGGFLLSPPDIRPFPIKASSILYLTKENYIKLPSITAAEIWDKSKADKFAKMVALLQIGWLVISSIARAAQQLAISPLELFTLAFVTSTFMTYYFWLHKPQQVATPTTITMSTPMSTVLASAGGDARLPWMDTPMDFIEKKDIVWTRRNMLQKFDLDDRPLTRIPDDSSMPGALGPLLLLLVGGPSALHSSIHLLGWNFTYPTTIERDLWRYSGITLLAVSVPTVALVGIMNRINKHTKFNLVWIWVKPTWGVEIEERSGWLLDAALTFCCLVLIAARFVIVGVAISTLRNLPNSAYTTISWSNFLPHL